jgi:hypothetical protein
MTLTEILPSLKKLNHKEKLKAVQFLVNEIAVEEEILLESGKEYPIHSVYDSYEAGDALLKLLEQENAKLEKV